MSGHITRSLSRSRTDAAMLYSKHRRENAHGLSPPLNDTANNKHLNDQTTGDRVEEQTTPVALCYRIGK